MLRESTTHDARSENMRRIRSRDSKPELIIRKLLFAQGYRYRLHSKKLPGSPDIVFPGRKKVLFMAAFGIAIWAVVWRTNLSPIGPTGHQNSAGMPNATTESGSIGAKWLGLICSLEV